MILGLRELILVSIIVPCALVALRRPVFGCLMFVWLGFFNPQHFTWGSTPLSMLMASCTIVGYLLWSEPKTLPIQRETILLLLLWIFFGITTVFAIYPDRAVKDLVHISKILLMVFLSMCLLNAEDRLRWLVRVIALSLGFYALKGMLFVVITGGESSIFGPRGSFLHANNTIGLALGMNLPLLAYLIKHEDRPWLRWICRAMFIASYPVIVFTYSRGAWLGLGAVTGLMVLRSRYKFRIAAATVIFTLGLAPFAVHFVPERLISRYERLENYEEDSSAQMRFGSWAYCLRVGMNHPLTGGGFEHYSVRTYDQYSPEYLDQWGGAYRWRRTSCHSVWLSILGEHGIPGFLLWAGLIGSVILGSWQIRSVAKTHPELSWMSDLAAALQVAIICYSVVGTFIDAAYFDMLYYMVAIVVIMKERLEHSLVAKAVPGADNVAFGRVPISVKGTFAR